MSSKTSRRTARTKTRRKSDHQHSSLSLGHITRIEDNAGRKDARGEGFELRTDGHGAIRAKDGLLITTEARINALRHAKDLGETAMRLTRAREQHENLAEAAQLARAQDTGMQLYWRWRLMHAGNVAKLPSYQQASAQDRIDMRESDADFSSDMAAALWQEKTESALTQTEPLAAAISGLSEAQKDFLRIHAEFAQGAPASKLPLAIDQFFDQLVHDSHASFYMVGPVTAFDRKEKIKQIEKKVEANRRFIARVKETSAALILPPGAVRQPMPPMDETRSLSELERRVWEYQKTHPGEFPLLSDADRAQLLAMEDIVTSGAVRLVTNKTRRELGGHVRYRRVFDRS
ncbi:type VI secretion system Vgr family protein [Variovorax sp. VaC1]|uniref:type VI secretion system Vgr family protein n=1 Tax=Variovorax sp. VaC1 TaxID=3373132 RepID=UPI003747CEA7